MRKVIFSHGKESGPRGTKIQRMQEIAKRQGFKTLSVDYTRCQNAAERVELLKGILEKGNPAETVLVGSSMGGYVATVAASEYQVAGLFVLCPALFMPAREYEVQAYFPKCAKVEIIHGWGDEVVPHEHSIRFGKQVKAVVNLVDDGHRLKESLDFIAQRFDVFLKNL